LRFAALWSDIAWVRLKQLLKVTLALSYDGPQITTRRWKRLTAMAGGWGLHLVCGPSNWSGERRWQTEGIWRRAAWETGYWRTKAVRI